MALKNEMAEAFLLGSIAQTPPVLLLTKWLIVETLHGYTLPLKFGAVPRCTRFEPWADSRRTKSATSGIRERESRKDKSTPSQVLELLLYLAQHSTQTTR